MKYVNNAEVYNKLLAISEKSFQAIENTIPSFSVLKDGEKVKTLEHCFLEHMLLFCSNPPVMLKAKNGANYVAVYDNLILPTKDQSATIKVIVSFQKHTYGSFAIVRNYNPSIRNEIENKGETK